MVHSSINKRAWLAAVSIPVGILFFAFRSLITNLSTHLFDWHDYPLFVWIIQHNLKSFETLNFSHFFDAPIFYPHPFSLLFSDLFITQTLLVMPIHFIVSNPISLFNILFLLTIILNSVCSYYLWSSIFRSFSATFFATLTTLLSTFMFHNAVHFQIFSLWPLLLCFGWFVRQKNLNWQSAIAGGTTISLLFYSSIYLWLIGITAMSFWYTLTFIHIHVKNTDKSGINLLKFLFIVMSVFVATSGVTLYKYWQTKQFYQAQREYSEYVSYAADIADYFFPPHTQSVLWNNAIGREWLSHAHRHGIFPGIVVVTIAVFGVLQGLKKRQQPSKKLFIFFFILMLVGFVFALGPRFQFQGDFSLRIPLPYYLILKSVKVFEVIRVTSRWSVLFFISLSFFAGKGIERLNQKKRAKLTTILSVLFVLEVVPLNLTTRQEFYYPEAYQTIAKECHAKQSVLLELPMTVQLNDATISTKLSYRTQMLLAQAHHNCLLVNGYSGYTPKEYEIYETTFTQAVETVDTDGFFSLLKQGNIHLLKLNKHRMSNKSVRTLQTWLSESADVTQLYENEEYLVVQIQ